MILHDNGRSFYVTPAKELPRFPKELEQQAEAKMLAAETPDQTIEFLQWWGEQCSKREIPIPHLRTGESIVTLRRLLSKHDYATLQGAALMVLNNLADPLRDGYRHHMRYLASQMPEAMGLLARWEKKDA